MPITTSSEKLRVDRLGQGNDPAQDGYRSVLIAFDRIATFSNVGGAVEFAAVSLAGLPKADIIIVGGYLHLDAFESPAQANIIDTFALSYSLGTVATVNNSLADATDFDLKTAVTIAAATAGVAPHDKGVLNGAKVLAMNPASAYFDNNDGLKAVFLNMTLPDNNISGLATLRVKGTLRLLTQGLGKNA